MTFVIDSVDWLICPSFVRPKDTSPKKMMILPPNTSFFCAHHSFFLMATQSTRDHILTVSNTRNSEDAASQIEHLNENHNMLVLRRLLINKNLFDALSRTLRRRGNTNKSFKGIELRNVNGDVESVISLCMASMAVEALYLLINNIELDRKTWFTIGRNLCTSTLQCLRVTTDLNALGMEALSVGLRSTSHLKTLEFDCSYLEDDETVISLALGLRENRSLEKIGFRSCNLQDMSVAHLVAAVHKHPHLKVLDLNTNRAGMSTSREVAKLLASNTCRLRKLNLSCQCEKLDIRMISEALQNNQFLTVLNISDCKIDDTDVETICKVLVTNHQLACLFLERNKITNVGIKHLAYTLPKIRILKELELRGNRFDAEGGRAFAVGLERNYSLEKVILSPHFESSDLISYYSFLNRAGRKLIRSSDFPLSLWSLVLSRIETIRFPMKSNVSHHDLIYFMLHGPAFVQANS